MRIVDATVTRRSRSDDIIGPAQQVDVMTALKAMTLWPAYQHFDEAFRGSIEVGKVADFVILSDDPTGVNPETLDAIKVTETVKRGTTIYLRGQKKAELLRRRDIVNPGFFEMLRQVHILREMDRMPEQFRTAEAKAAIDGAYDDRAASLLLPWLFGLDSGTYRRAAN